MEIISSGVLLAILWYLIKDSKKDVKADIKIVRDDLAVVKNNHLAHIQEDITDIKVRIAVLEDHDK